MICKMEEQTREFDLRFDAQRREMMRRESSVQSRVDALTVEVSQLMQEVQTMKETERKRQDDVKRTDAEEGEVSDVIRSLQQGNEVKGSTRLCRNCSRAEKINAL